ncbi:amidohydrolase family protein [Chloroflexota bacterium]
MKRIAIEEHYLSQNYLSYLRSRKAYPRIEIVEDDNHRRFEQVCYSPVRIRPRYLDLVSKLADLGEGRLSEMDAAGISMQVLSLASGGIDMLEESEAISISRKTNDELSGVVKKCPDRYAGLATLARHDPTEAARELERAVKELGLKGASVDSHFRGEYLDNEKYSVILEMAQKLDVPIYIHPREPSPDMRKPYMDYPILARAMWGFAAETGLHAMRLICSGVFDRYPGLKIILGHMGEALPFWLWRLDDIWLHGEVVSGQQGGKLEKLPSQYIKDNFFVTTSGMCWYPALLCAYLGLGADKILFAVDYPFQSNNESVGFMDTASICDSDKEKIYHSNAERLLTL